jgi:hypothetical protein
MLNLRMASILAVNISFIEAVTTKLVVLCDRNGGKAEEALRFCARPLCRMRSAT